MAGLGEEWRQKEGMVGVEMRLWRNTSCSYMYYHSQMDYNRET